MANIRLIKKDDILPSFKAIDHFTAPPEFVEEDSDFHEDEIFEIVEVEIWSKTSKTYLVV